MKAILEFELPEDHAEFKISGAAMSWALVASDVDAYLRNKLKYGHEFKTIDDALEATRTFLHEALENHGVSLDDIE